MSDNRCPNCGRYIEDEPDGFFDVEWPYTSESTHVVYCNEACCNAQRNKDLADHGKCKTEDCGKCDDGMVAMLAPGYDGEADVDFVKCEYCNDS